MVRYKAIPGEACVGVTPLTEKQCVYNGLQTS